MLQIFKDAYFIYVRVFFFLTLLTVFPMGIFFLFIESEPLLTIIFKLPIHICIFVDRHLNGIIWLKQLFWNLWNQNSHFRESY